MYAKEQYTSQDNPCRSGGIIGTSAQKSKEKNLEEEMTAFLCSCGTSSNEQTPPILCTMSIKLLPCSLTRMGFLCIDGGGALRAVVTETASLSPGSILV